MRPGYKPGPVHQPPGPVHHPQGPVHHPPGVVKPGCGPVPGRRY